MSFCENTSEEAKRKDALRLLARSVRAQCARQSGQIGRHERLCVQLRPLLASRALQGKAVAGYMAVRGELSCMAALKFYLHHLRGHVMLPRVTSRAHEMDMVRVHSFERGLQVGRWGILEPLGEVAPLSKLGLVLVPGLMFDRYGGRLGMGGGYYDLFLSKVMSCPRRPVILGVCDDELLVSERLPMQAHDIRMDGVISPTGVIWFNSRVMRGLSAR